MEVMSTEALAWLYRELKRTKIALAHLERRDDGGCGCCRERHDLERKQAVVEWLIGRVLSDD